MEQLIAVNMNTVTIMTAMSLAKGVSATMMTATNIAAARDTVMTDTSIAVASDTVMSGMSIAAETKAMSTVAAAMSAPMMITMSTDAMRTTIKMRKLVR
ncbi:MAG: hypothetical protein D3917_00955 [Candidatus Electrothrix sp. AX5]|nr:hypothetical protein [Candidatus Electrothrix sp. AX5]